MRESKTFTFDRLSELAQRCALALALVTMLVACGGKKPKPIVTKSTVGDVGDAHTIALFTGGEYSLKSYLGGAASVFRDLYGCRTELLEAAPLKNYRGKLPIHPEVIVEAALADADQIVELKPDYDELRGQGLQGYKLTLFMLPDVKPIFSVTLPTDARFEPLLKQKLKRKKLGLDKKPMVDMLDIADVLRNEKQHKDALRIYELVASNDGASDERAKRALDGVASLKRTIGLGAEDTQVPTAGTFVHVEYGELRREFRDAFNLALEKTDVSEQLVGMSRSPAVIVLKPVDQDDRRLRLTLKIDFDRSLYRQLASNEPKNRGGMTILPLKPFHKLMYRVLRLKGAFLKELSDPARKQVQELKSSLLLHNAAGVEVTVPIIVGKMGKILQPAKIHVKRGSDKKQEFEAASKRIFDRYGQFALGSPTTKGGKTTRWQVLYEFFGL